MRVGNAYGDTTLYIGNSKEVMMNKYIVKNCELICNGECPNSETGFCEDCTDCRTKQVIEKCKEELDDKENWCHRQALANEILQLFEIEEVEDED